MTTWETDDAGEPAGRIDLAWLDDPKQRRGTLLLIHSAVCRGWYADPSDEGQARRSELVRRLAALQDAPALKPREARRIVRILAAMERVKAGCE